MRWPFASSLAVLAVALVTAAPAGAATVVHTWHANLDGDSHRELVQLVKNGAPHQLVTAGCGWSTA